MSISEYFIPLTKMGISLHYRQDKLIFFFSPCMKRMCLWSGFQNARLTEQDGRPASLYRRAALPESTKTHRPPEPHSHRGPASSAACTTRNWKHIYKNVIKKKTEKLGWNYFENRIIWIRKYRNFGYHFRSMSWVYHHFQMSNMDSSQVERSKKQTSLPGWCCACAGSGGQCGPPATWPGLGKHSFGPPSPRRWPEQTDSAHGLEIEKSGRLISERRWKVTRTVDFAATPHGECASPLWRCQCCPSGPGPCLWWTGWRRRWRGTCKTGFKQQFNQQVQTGFFLYKTLTHMVITMFDKRN